jgi:chromate transporter
MPPMMPDTDHDDDAPRAAPASCRELFTTFTLLALQGFGGVLAIAQRVLCDDKRWLSRRQFTELLSIGQVLPGPNVCNVSLMVGDRYFGTRGAFAALAGMMTVPLALVLALAALYAHYATLPAVASALKGMGEVSAGMIIGSALKLAAPLRRSALGLPLVLLFAAAAFVMVALLRWPLVWVLLGLGSAACISAGWRLAARAARQTEGV